MVKRKYDTMPLLEHYPDLDKLWEMDGNEDCSNCTSLRECSEYFAENNLTHRLSGYFCIRHTRNV